MDVTCDRCDTVYEFDETLLSAKGTPVKCTNCGHTFKVYPRAAEGTDRTTSSWRLRTRDGTIDTIDSMGELQRRISRGELTPEDEIARGDEEWKKLGAIRDLERLFEAAGIRVAGAPIPSPIPPVAPRDPSRESSLPPGKRPRQPTLLGVSPIPRMQGVAGLEPAPTPEPAPQDPEAPEPEMPAEGEVSPAPDAVLEPEREPEPSAMPPEAPETTREPRDPDASYRSPYTRDSLPDRALIEAEDAEFEEAPPASTSVRTSTPPPAYYDDDNDIPELPARGMSPLRWLLLIVIFGGLALVVTRWERVARLVGIGSDPALIAAGVTEGDAALAEGHGVAYETAIDAYARAVEAGGDGDVEVMAKLSQAYALAAQAKLDAGESGAAVDGLTQSAVAAAVTATSLDPRSLEAKLARIDAHRLQGEHGAARELINEARDLSFSRTAEFYRVEARLLQAEAEGRLEEGLRSARQAAELAPRDARYVLLRARAEVAAGNEEQAREALATVLADHPDHPVAQALLTELDEVAAAAAAAAATVDEPTADGGVGSEPDAPAEAESDEAAAAEKSLEPPPEAASEPASEPKPEPAVTKPASAPAKATQAPVKRAAAPQPSTDRVKAPGKRPELDEYDRLAAAAGSDAFVDGRPPVLEYEANMKKGREELAAGNHARARAYFDSALEVHPGSADAMDALGDVATAVSDYGSALRYYRVAAQRGHPEGYFKLGRTYERLGRTDEAVSAHYTYITRRPNGKHVEAARRAIRRLEPRAKLPPPADAESGSTEPQPREPSAEPPTDDPPEENTEPPTP